MFLFVCSLIVGSPSMITTELVYVYHTHSLRNHIIINNNNNIKV
jgi:hypothetical protein